MKITLAYLIESRPSLEKLFNANLPIKTSFRLRKIISKINDELKHFEEERIKLAKTLGAEEEGKFTIKGEGNLNKFRDAMAELLKEEIEMEFDAISVDSLGEDLKLSPLDADNLIKSNILKE